MKGSLAHSVGLDWGLIVVEYRAASWSTQKYLLMVVMQRLIIMLANGFNCATHLVIPSTHEAAYTLQDKLSNHHTIKSSTPGQNGHHFTDNIFRSIFWNEKFCLLINMSLKFVPKGPIDNKPALVQVMAWRRTGDKPLSEPMLTRFTNTSMRQYIGGDELMVPAVLDLVGCHRNHIQF